MKREVPSTSNWLDASQQLLPPRVMPLEESMVMDLEAKIVTTFLSEESYPGPVEIMMLTDLQFGSKGFKDARFREFRDWILGQPSCFVVLGGDLIDAATVMSVASPYENKWQPSEQVLNLVKLLSPLRGRILGYVGGNHERRTVKGFGDAGVLIATLLKIPYSRGEQTIDVQYGQHQPFRIALWHGSGSARTKGAKAQMLHRFMHRGEADVYLCGHLHDAMVLFDWRERIRKRKGEKVIELDKIAGIMSSSFQDYWNSYAETVGLPPSDTMMALIRLYQDGAWEVNMR